MAQINLDGFGYNEFVTVTGSKTLALADCGVVQNVTANATITLPATVVGYFFIVRIGKEGITVNVDPAAADQIAGGGGTAVDNKDLIFANQPAGSYVAVGGDGTTAVGYVVHRVNGVFTRQA